MLTSVLPAYFSSCGRAVYLHQQYHADVLGEQYSTFNLVGEMGYVSLIFHTTGSFQKEMTRFVRWMTRSSSTLE